MKKICVFLAFAFNSIILNAQNQNFSKPVSETVIYLTPKQEKTLNVDCPNMGFEQNNFSNWSGEVGTNGNTSGAGGSYATTSFSIANSAGNNVSIVNSVNYHTLMTRPALNNNYPNCIGYDSLACKIVGTGTVSEIPVVSPFSQDTISVRMNGAVALFRACRLKYITTRTSSNKTLSYSFALVLEGGNHPTLMSPYFKAVVRNETTGQLISACDSIYLDHPYGATPVDSFMLSPIYIHDIFYRKWQLHKVDLSMLPIGTNVSVMFEVADCNSGGHYGYAYVDAECGSSEIVSSSMCLGASTSTLVAQPGFVSYQWFNPTNGLIVGATNDTIVIANPNMGDVFSVQLTSIGGCVQTHTVSISANNNSTVSINSSNSLLCAGQSATLIANGATSYLWNTGDTTHSIVVAPTINTIYSVTGTNSDGCSSVGFITQNVATCTNLNEQPKSNYNIVVYPNPAKGLLSINSNDVIKKISVMNVLGETVQSIVTDSKEVLLNISELKPNIYFLQITTANNQVYNQKIVKE